MIIEICVGSSCHLKGSYDVINEIEYYIKNYGLEGKIELRGSFCIGHCTEGVSLKINENHFSASKESIINILDEIIKEKYNAAFEL